jgi:hypothetical protein
MALANLRDIAKQQGWNVEYDQPSNMVKVLNPTANKTISFLSGKGQEYGLGGLINGYNSVADVNKLYSALTPKLPTVTPTQSNTNGINISQNNNAPKDLGNNNANQQGTAGIPVTPVPQGTPVGGQAGGQGNVNTVGTGGQTAQTVQTVSTSPQAFSQDEILSKIENLKQAQTNELISSLQGKYNKAVSEINGNIAQVAPKYEELKRQTNANSQVQAQKFAEFLAARGLSRDGYALQYESDRQNQLLNSMSQYDKQQESDLNYYRKQLDDARNSYDSDVNSAKQKIASDYLSNFINYMKEANTERSNNYYKQLEIDLKKEELNNSKINSKYKNETDKQQQAIENQNKQELDTYGFTLTDPQRKMKDAFETAMKNPEFAQLYRTAYNSPGGIASLIQQANQEGRSDLLPALEGGRFMKVLNEGLTQYAGQYNLPQKWYKNTAETSTAKSESVIKMYKADLASELESLGLMKAANEVRKGNLDVAKAEIENSYLPQEKQMDLFQKSKNVENIDNQIKNRDAGTFIAQQNASTSAFNAQTSRMNADTSAFNAQTSRINSNRAQEQFNSKQDNETFNTLDKQITNVYTSVDDTGRTVYSVQDKKDIDAFTANLINQGVSVDIVNALRTKYNIPKLPK